MTTELYSIVVRGRVEPPLLELLGDPDARPGPDSTELVCAVVDQSHLVGLLSRLSRAEVEVISARPLGTRRL